MKKVIIYIEDTGNIAVIVPMPECLKKHSVQEIAIKDVPAGKKFKIVDSTDIPWHIPQEAWEINEADLIDGIGGKSYEFNKN